MLHYFQEEWLYLLIHCIMCPLHLVVSLILLRHLGGAMLFWVARCLPIMLLGDRAFICIFWSPKILYVSCHWRIGGDGNSCSQQSPESLLVDLSILTASFCKHCCWPWPSDLRLLWWVLLWVGRAPCPCLFPLGIVGLCLKVSCLQLI